MSFKNNDDDSFIILGTSPESFLTQCNEARVLEADKLDEASNDLTSEDNKNVIPRFAIGNSPNLMVSSIITENERKEGSNRSPSPSSMMMSMSLIMDDLSKEQLQKRLVAVLDENVVLKNTIKLNNKCMKEQFSEYSLIASCQEDMVRTQQVHHEKFEKTKALVEKLRSENKQMKEEIVRLKTAKDDSLINVKSGPSSALEFVASPDDDTIDKLTSQLELIEKQRRQLVVENENLTWQRQSLERVNIATVKDRDELQKKFNDSVLQLVSRENSHKEEIEQPMDRFGELRQKIKSMSLVSLHSSVLEKKNASIKELEAKVSLLQKDLKKAQITIIDLENVKLDFATHKSEVSDKVKMYKNQIKDLNIIIKSLQTTVFQPVPTMPVSEGSSKSAKYVANVKLYNCTLKHLAEYFNNLTDSLAKDITQIMETISTVHDAALGRASIDIIKTGLMDIKKTVSAQHSSVVNNIAQVKGSLKVFEGIFHDHKAVLKKRVSKSDDDANVEKLTSALMARGEEILNLENEIAILISHKEDCDALKAQAEIYKSDFDTERKSREAMASELDKLGAEARQLRKQFQEALSQLDEVRKISPMAYKTAVVRAKAKPAAVLQVSATSPSPSTANTPGQETYTCPKCNFSTDQYVVLQDHFEDCLDDF